MAAAIERWLRAANEAENSTTPKPKRAGTLVVASILAAIVGMALTACSDDDSASKDTVGPAVDSSGATASNTAAPTAAEPSASTAAGTTGLSLVVIGDSLPFGGHFCGGCQDVGKIYGEMIETETVETVKVTNKSSDQGIDSKQLLQSVRTDDSMRTALADADILVVSSGHNDTPWNVTDDPCDGSKIEDGSDWAAYTPECSDAAAQQYRPLLDGVLDEIATLRQGKPTAVRVLTFYNDLVGWPDAPRGAEAASVNVLNAFNPVICESAAARDAVCVDIYHAFNGANGQQPAGALLEGDYTHPSQDGHQKMAELLLASGLAPLR